MRPTQAANSARQVYCEDALAWLSSQQSLAGCSLVASLPDISEFPSYSLAEWQEWFIRSASLVLSSTPVEGVSVFYQSDIKRDGCWVDKAYLCQKAAEQLMVPLLWHKVVCRVSAGQTTFGRPAYSHVLCFSRGVRVPKNFGSPDVLPSAGDKTWERGMGLEACMLIAKFIAEQTSTKTLVNPFCGQGSMLAAAEAWGLSAVGIERSPKRAALARVLVLDEARRSFVKQTQVL
jgi:hypothetical protein